MNKPALIVARYNEDMTWTREFADSVSLYIYNKGEPNIDCYKQLENVGRESHTYVRFILDHYENLPIHNIFVQGDAPCWRHRGILNEIKSAIKTPPTKKYSSFIGSFNSEDFNVKGTKVPNFIVSEFPIYQKTPDFVYTQLLKRDSLLIADIEYTVAPCACFYVHRDNILRHSKETYQRIYEEHYNPIHVAGPGTVVQFAGTMEYAWHLIFDDIYYLNK